MGIQELIQEAEKKPARGPEQMVAYGRIWLGYVKMTDGSGVASGDRKLVLDAVNAQLKAVSLSVTPGFQPYEPIVRASGRARKYVALAADLAAGADGGVGEAKAILKWMTAEADITTLSQAAKEFVVITHFTEVGRGFTDAPSDIYRLLQEIAASTPATAKTKWTTLAATWVPATTYAQDVKADYDPNDM